MPQFKPKYFALALAAGLTPGATHAQFTKIAVDTDRLYPVAAEWEKCVKTEAPIIASQTTSFKEYEKGIRDKCKRFHNHVHSILLESLTGLDPDSAEAYQSNKSILEVLKRIRATFGMDSEQWFSSQRKALAIPRFLPGTGGEECAKRIASRRLGNHDAVERAFSKTASSPDPLASTQQSQERTSAQQAAALAAIDHAQGKPVVYTSLPIRMQASTSSSYASYDADRGVLSVSIIDTSSYDPSDRDSVGSDMLILRHDTIKGGSYGAQNAFGARTTVTDYTSVVHHWQVSDGGAGKYKLAVDLPITAAALRPQLAQLRLFILGELQKPYVTRRNIRYRLPTLRNPSNEAIDAVIVHAPLRCAAIFNAATGKVLTGGEIKLASQL